MRAIILAGGLGTRLQSAVPDLPKPLAPIHQRPFLEYQMDYWIGKGVTEFYLSVCYLAQKIKDHFQESYRGCKISYIREPLPLGTGGAILYCLSKLPNKNEDVVILNGDTFVELDFDKMLGSHQKNASHLSVALREVEQNDRYSAVVLDKENKIIEFCQSGTADCSLVPSPPAKIMALILCSLLSFYKRNNSIFLIFPVFIKLMSKALYGLR